MVSPLIEKSDANWKLADQLRESGNLDAAANRFYYSLFQIVKAYAIKTGKIREDDDKAVHAKALNIVRSDREDASTFSRAMNMRTSADYLSYLTTDSDLCQDFVYRAQLLRDHYRHLAAS